MADEPLRYTPSLDLATIAARLDALLPAGEIGDDDLARRGTLLDKRFASYAAIYPFGLWAPGLVVSREMRALTDLYLPWAEIRPALYRFLSFAIVPSPPYPQPLLEQPNGWLELLAGLGGKACCVNPGVLLRRLCHDCVYRRRFLFALFLPRRHGGGFGRYPGQRAFLGRWLANRRSSAVQFRCLDAACGSGEGTYELAMLLAGQGSDSGVREVHGASLAAVEVFAAAHAFVPHDQRREAAYRRVVEPFLAAGGGKCLEFFQEDLATAPVMEKYRIICCNGVLGGPLLGSSVLMREAVGRLAGRLEPGGLLLVADRFHDGRQRRETHQTLASLFSAAGLRVQEAGEGLAGEKTGRL